MISYSLWLDNISYLIDSLLSFKIDPESLSSWNKTRKEEKSKHLVKIEEETKRLKEEFSKYNDILLLDVTDTYRNLPKKMLLFYQW